MCNLPSVCDPKSQYKSQSEVVPRTHLKLKGDQAFAVAGPKLWNSLPQVLREVSTLNVFKVEVKNYLLSLAFESVG